MWLFTPKDWINGPPTTPLSAAALKDLEQRVHDGTIADSPESQGKRVFYVDDPPFNAVPDAYYTDGGATSGDKTFTSATASFVAGDVGKTIVLLDCGPQSTEHPLHTTITSLNSSSSVELNAAPSRTKTGTRFYISRSGAQTTAIQAAIDAAAAAGGGVVRFGGPGYLTGGLIQKNRVWLDGRTDQATYLHLANSSNTHLIANYVSSNGTTDANAQRVGVFNMMLDGNKANQTSGTSHGIYLTENPAWVQTTQDEGYDPRNRLGRLKVVNCRNDGINCANVRQMTTGIDIDVQFCDGRGLFASSDVFFCNVLCGWSGLAGFATDGNVCFANCFAYYSGQITSASGFGFDLNSSLGALLANCRAQDNKVSGYSLSGASGASLVGCVADSNSTASAGAEAGFDFYNTVDCTLSGCKAYDRMASPTQLNALRMRSTSVRNRIDIQHVVNFPFAGAGGAHFKTLESTCYNNEFHINEDQGFEPVTFASPLAPNPYKGLTKSVTLTGALTINAPTGATSEIFYPGMRVRFMLLQDSNGGRVVTWNSAFKTSSGFTPNTAANKMNIYEFQTPDGTNWYQVSGMTV